MTQHKGFSLVELLIVIAIIGIIATAAVPSYMKMKRAANETAAVKNLETLNQAQQLARRGGRYLNLSELVSGNFIDNGWRNGVERQSYKFQEVGSFDSATFEFSAEPVSASAGDRAFNVIEDGRVREAEGISAPTRESGRVLGTDGGAPQQ